MPATRVAVLVTDEGFQLIGGMVTSGGATSHVDDVPMDKTPYLVWHRYQARTFAAGHYLVEVAVDVNLIDSHEFDVVPNT